MSNQKFDNYTERGELWNGWVNNHVLDAAMSFSTKTNDKLDIRLRGNKIHIYYLGGKILEVCPKSYHFDSKYLNTEAVSSDIEDFKRWIKPKNSNGFCSLHATKVEKQPEEYFKSAALIMDNWFKCNNNKERHDQHMIATTKQQNLNVVDIEYAVSFNSYCYNKAYMDSQKSYERYPNPRFDLITLDKENGQLYVLELKTGLDSTDNMEKHVMDFINFIGSDECEGEDKKSRWEHFVKEVTKIVNSYNEKWPKTFPELPLPHRPRFYFAFTEKDGEHKIDEFREKVETTFKDIENKAEVAELLKTGILNKEVLYITSNFQIPKPQCN